MKRRLEAVFQLAGPVPAATTINIREFPGIRRTKIVVEPKEEALLLAGQN